VQQMRTNLDLKDNNSTFEGCVQANNKDVLIVWGQIYDLKVGVAKIKGVLNAEIAKNTLLRMV
jgi:hypothetical protein